MVEQPQIGESDNPLFFGLDINNDGQITKAEATHKVLERMDVYGKKEQ